jgi:hypothetical protein
VPDTIDELTREALRQPEGSPRGPLSVLGHGVCRPAGVPFARDRKLTHERPTRRGGRRGKAAKERINVSAVAAQSKRIVVSKVVTIACDHSTSVARSVSFASADPGPVLRLGPGSYPRAQPASPPRPTDCISPARSP